MYDKIKNVAKALISENFIFKFFKHFENILLKGAHSTCYDPVIIVIQLHTNVSDHYEEKRIDSNNILQSLSLKGCQRPAAAKWRDDIAQEIQVPDPIECHFKECNVVQDRIAKLKHHQQYLLYLLDQQYLLYGRGIHTISDNW